MNGSRLRNIADTAVETTYRNWPVSDEKTFAEYLERRLREMIEVRRPWDDVWDAIRAKVLPERQYLQGYYDNSVSTFESPRRYLETIAGDIYNTDAQQSIHLLTAGIQGYVLNQSAPWFAHTTAKETHRDGAGVLQYLAEVDEQLISAISRSNFYSETVPLIQDCAGLGTGTLYYEPAAADQYSFQCIPQQQLYLDEDAQRNIDTVYRVFAMTKRQLIQEFGLEALSKQIRNESNDARKFNVLHAVFPRDDARDQEMGVMRRLPSSLLSMDAPYISVYKELSGEEGLAPWNSGGNQEATQPDEHRVLHVGGYRHFPYASWRWQVVTPYPYAIGPTQTILPQIYQADFFSKMLSLSAQLHVDPPWVVSGDMQQEPDLMPGGLTFLLDPRARIQALANAGGAYPIGIDREERITKAIRDHFGVEYFLLVSGTTATAGRTATEILEMQSEKAAVLNIMMGRLGIDVLRKVLTFMFYRESQAGRMPDRPPFLDEFSGTPDGRLDIQYISPLALAQRRLAHLIGPLRAWEALIPLWQAVPEALDSLKSTEFARALLIAGGVNPRHVRSLDEIESLRHIAAQRMHKQQELDAAEQTARAVRNADIDISQAGQGQMGQEILSLMQAA